MTDELAAAVEDAPVDPAVLAKTKSLVHRKNYDLESAALRVHGALSFRDWEAIGTWLEAAERGVQWWIGDWLVYGESRFGEQYTQAVEATGWRLGTVKQYQYVAERVPPENRRPMLSFSHHREVADLPADQQVAWLEKAQAGDEGGEWTAERLRRALKEATHGTPAAVWVVVKTVSQAAADELVLRLNGEGYEAKVR